MSKLAARTPKKRQSQYTLSVQYGQSVSQSNIRMSTSQILVRNWVCMAQSNIPSGEQFHLSQASTSVQTILAKIATSDYTVVTEFGRESNVSKTQSNVSMSASKKQTKKQQSNDGPVKFWYERESNFSRAHSKKSTCVWRGLWTDGQPCAHSPLYYPPHYHPLTH